MKLAWFIARNYLISKKSVNIINIISIISAAGVAVGTMALIVVMSAMNGLNGFIGQMLSTFDPDLKITLREGKSFAVDAPELAAIIELPQVHLHAWVAEDNAFLTHRGRQYLAVIKGIDDNYDLFSDIGGAMTQGEFKLHQDSIDCAVMGVGAAYHLSVNFRAPGRITAYYPRAESGGTGLLKHKTVLPAGAFSIQQEIDDNYVLVPLAFAQSLFGMEGRATSLELKLMPAADSGVKLRIRDMIGDRFDVKDRFEQHEFLFRVMSSEKWAGFLILCFILLIASFNLLGSLTMVIIDKKSDIFVLQSMGADSRLICRIFRFEGWLVSLSGAVTGCLVGIGLVVLQNKYGLLKLAADGSFAISAYPVALQWTDVVLVMTIVLFIGFLAAWYPTVGLKRLIKV
jgi:lipoprotein-releasing system permease protein